MASTSSSSSSSTSSCIDPGATATPATTAEAIAPLTLDIKYVDSRFDENKDAWDYGDTLNSEVAAELVQPVGTHTTDDDDSWKKFCFVVVRKYSRAEDKRKSTISFQIVIKSPYLRTACSQVMAQLRGISWVSEPLELEPTQLITFFPKFEEYEIALATRTRTEEEERILASLRVLLDYMRKNYRQTLARISSLVSHGEITFDLLYAILVPGTIILNRCQITRETRALRLTTASKSITSSGQFYNLQCEALEEFLEDGGNDNDEPTEIGWGDKDEASNRKRWGWVSRTAQVWDFAGVEKINTLNAFPIQFHPDEATITSMLVARGRKWASLSGMHHVFYRGTAARWKWVSGSNKVFKYTVNCRIVIDKASFHRVDTNYEFPPAKALIGRTTPESLTEEEILLASPIVYGFSLSDKLWLEYNVNHVSDIEWNDEAFAGLVLPAERKTFLRSLVEVHGRLNSSGPGGFDDFVRGKGQGLVINLYGPPGVGKTLSAEATSEHLRRPLYIIGSGGLGTTSYEIDSSLEFAFDLAACWNAVLLIDEADVFLEQRSLHDLERNAVVAVFLRHIEYYRGIMFLTTNRVKTFDEAFLSRIHVAMHYTELSTSTKAQVWRAFLVKAGVDPSELSDELIDRLAQRDVNGRQIKNACKTATSLATSRGEKMQYEHVAESLNAMDEFLADFAAIRNYA